MIVKQKNKLLAMLFGKKYFRSVCHSLVHVEGILCILTVVYALYLILQQEELKLLICKTS
jgi:predicted permease